MKKIAIIIFPFLLFACSSKEKKAVTNDYPKIKGDTLILTAQQIKNASLEFVNSGAQSVSSTISANGVVDVPPQSLVSISVPMGGYVKRTQLLPGMAVSKGQVLATIEDPIYVQLQQDYLSAKARLQYLNADRERQKELSAEKAVSSKTYQLANSEYQSLYVQMKAMEEKLRIANINPGAVSVGNIQRTVNIYSPISGYVSKVNVNVGKYVTPSEVLFEIVDPRDIHASITVFERDIAKFTKGMAGKVYVNNQMDKPYNVSVLLVSRNVDENRSGIVHCHFEDARHDLLPGMFLTARFVTTGSAKDALPEAAIVHYEGADFVFVAKNDSTFVLTPVVVGNNENGFISILNNEILTNQKIVSKGAFNLLGALKGGDEEE